MTDADKRQQRSNHMGARRVVEGEASSPWLKVQRAGKQSVLPRKVEGCANRFGRGFQVRAQT